MLWSLVHDGQYQPSSHQRYIALSNTAVGSRDWVEIIMRLTKNNPELILINSGRPVVHPDDDLIVSHIAFDIGTEEKMEQLIR